MDSKNLLIFTVYFIIVSYVFYKAYKSLESQITLELNTEALNQELEEKQMKEIVEIDFKKLKKSYQFDELKTLRIGIKNKTAENDAITVRVNWDESSIENYEGNVTRVIRVTKAVTEIPGKQVPSIIVANQKLDEEISDDKDLNGTLFKVQKLKKATKKGTPFTLRISFKVSKPGKEDYSCFINCQLTPIKLRWTKALSIALIPVPKKKS